MNGHANDENKCVYSEDVTDADADGGDERILARLVNVSSLPPSLLHLKTILIDKTQFSIGRLPQNDCDIPYVSISRNHCSLIRNGKGGWSVTDLSTFGVQINGETVGKLADRPIRNGDVIQLDLSGIFKFKFSYDDRILEKRKRVPHEDEKPPKRSRLDDSADDLAGIMKELGCETIKSERFDDSAIETARKLKSERSNIKIITDELREDGEIGLSRKLKCETPDVKIEEPVKYEKIIENVNEHCRRALEIETKNYERKMKEISIQNEKKLEEMRKGFADDLKKFENDMERLKTEMEMKFKKKREEDERDREREKIEISLDSQASFTVKIPEGSKSSSSLGEILESELQCSICSELYINPYSLNCSHTFCEHCIKEWKEKQSQCPLCREKILSVSKNLFVNTLIDNLVDKMDPKSKKIRQKFIKQRSEANKQKKQSDVIDLTGVENNSFVIPDRPRRSTRRIRSTLPRREIF